MDAENGTLVLSRKKDQCIRIGEDVLLRVQEIGRGKVSLGFVAPRHVTVMRCEADDHKLSRRAMELANVMDH